MREVTRWQRELLVRLQVRILGPKWAPVQGGAELFAAAAWRAARVALTFKNVNLPRRGPPAVARRLRVGGDFFGRGRGAGRGRLRCCSRQRWVSGVCDVREDAPPASTRKPATANRLGAASPRPPRARFLVRVRVELGWGLGCHLWRVFFGSAWCRCGCEAYTYYLNAKDSAVRSRAD